ncbi:hypothetical protein LWH94_12615 [Marinobacter sp. G11]|jgi:antitoxin VapB|uniref:hypothetical protein n=1 Tax=Marinobacter sp. G11 TaxID=2903522 RepID=UPI001E2992E2|nr:hypothetical protein [Marinobacter sp. G11]MCE0760044.1 hypothetical protein [Marinobacter sp. G11]
MASKRPIEEELLKGRGKRFDRPTDSVWDMWFDTAAGVCESINENRNQPSEGQK